VCRGTQPIEHSVAVGARVPGPAPAAGGQVGDTGHAGRVREHPVERVATFHGRDEPDVADTIVALRSVVTALPVDAEVVAEARKTALQNLRTIDENHRARVDMATSTDAFTIALLIGTAIGAVPMTAFPLIFGLSGRPANLVMMVLPTP
jgi:hypothetical protein